MRIVWFWTGLAVVWMVLAVVYLVAGETTDMRVSIAVSFLCLALSRIEGLHDKVDER